MKGMGLPPNVMAAEQWKEETELRMLVMEQVPAIAVQVGYEEHHKPTAVSLWLMPGVTAV